MPETYHDAVIGVDPGDKGAICLLDIENDFTEFLAASEHPHVLWETYSRWMKAFNIRLVTVEDVHAIQGSAAKATFSFGANVERMVLLPTLLHLPLARMTPKVWHKELRISVTNTLKGPARKRAIKEAVASTIRSRFPKAELIGPKGGLLDGRSDALAIAEASRRILKIT